MCAKSSRHLTTAQHPAHLTLEIMRGYSILRIDDNGHWYSTIIGTGRPGNFQVDPNCILVPTLESDRYGAHMTRDDIRRRLESAPGFAEELVSAARRVAEAAAIRAGLSLFPGAPEIQCRSGAWRLLIGFAGLTLGGEPHRLWIETRALKADLRVEAVDVFPNAGGPESETVPLSGHRFLAAMRSKEAMLSSQGGLVADAVALKAGVPLADHQKERLRHNGIDPNPPAGDGCLAGREVKKEASPAWFYCEASKAPLTNFLHVVRVFAHSSGEAVEKLKRRGYLNISLLHVQS